MLELKQTFNFDNLLKLYNSQSHHAGIETLAAVEVDYLSVPPNRTMLELKQYYKSNRWTGISLPIAPCWNWNLLMPLQQLLDFFGSQSHHAGIETQQAKEL